jgi:hypothetical protein
MPQVTPYLHAIQVLSAFLHALDGNKYCITSESEVPGKLSATDSINQDPISKVKSRDLIQVSIHVLGIVKTTDLRATGRGFESECCITTQTS